MANRTIGILGLGIFGQSVLKTLQDQDVDIIAIDDHADVINQYESMITTGIVGDITDLDLLDAADIGNCDTVVIATGENLESSVLAVMHCKALGVENVIAKVKNEVTKEVLEKIGADLVILPEVEAGMSLAKMILFQHGIEVFQLDEAVVVVEFTVPASWVGKSIRDLEIRDQYQLNIIGYRDGEDQPLRSQIGPDFIWPEGVRVMAVTDNQYLDRIQDLLEETN
ncbi:NAD-binding protein [Streptococcus sp. W151]